MTQPSAARPPTPIATKLGFVLWGITLIWWFAYYAQYMGPFELLDLKIYCINGASSECLFFRERMGATMVPTYYPIFWYAGLIALLVGAHQSWQGRKSG